MLRRQTPLPTSLQNTTWARHPLLNLFPTLDEGFHASSSSQTAACLCDMNNDNSKDFDSRMGCSKALGSTHTQSDSSTAQQGCVEISVCRRQLWA